MTKKPGKSKPLDDRPTDGASAPRDPRGPVAACKPEEAALAPGLYLVATPIGNLADITVRALDTLRAADMIACEDTRRTRPLLSHYGVRATMVPLHDHNEAQAARGIVDHIEAGRSVALVSDAGMPLISDPGFGLVGAVRKAGHPVTSIPGPTAPLVALQLAGLPSDRFCFCGFPPPRQAARKRFLAEFAAVPASLIFFESPRRLAASLADMAAIFGPRQAGIARELTKLHEEVRTDTLTALADAYRDEGPPRGEIVVVVDRAEAEAGQADEGRLDELLRDALGRVRLKEAVAEVSAITGIARGDVYSRALALKNEQA
ncbi:MAG: 16S rRNA (cytidine(1402)-2'-O)-methyltransferase [Pseudomonadota bacterium]